MEPTKVRTKIFSQIQHMVGAAIIKDRRFLDDEQLIRSEQLAVLEEIFNANVRDTEIRELSSHFSAILRGDHPCHLAIWGKTGTGKTLTLSYFLNLLSEMCRAKNVPMRHEHLDLSNPRPCFRALNDLACMLNASKRYQKGISLEEMMIRIETKLAGYKGYWADRIANPRVVQELMGHAALSTTMEFYNKVVSDDMRKAASAIDALLAGSDAKTDADAASA